MKKVDLKRKVTEKAKALNLEDYVILNYEQLLRVNGAGGNSSSGTSGSSSSSSSSESSTSSSTTSSGPTNSSGGKGGSQSGPSSSNSGTTSSYGGSTPSTQVPTTGGTSSSGPSSSSSTDLNLGNVIEVKPGDTLGDLTWAYNQEHGTDYTADEIAEMNRIENPNLIEVGQKITFGEVATPSKPTTSPTDTSTNQNPLPEGNNTINPNGNTGGSSSSPSAEKSAKDKIVESIAANNDKKYIAGEYQCDEWTQEVLTDAGYDYQNYYGGVAGSTTCEEHITSLEKGTYTTSTPKEDGVYVVLMNDGHEYTKDDGKTGVLGAHTGILVVDGTNSYFVDNSSGNNKTGGVEKTYGTNSDVPTEIMSKFGYDSFYYQKIN